MYDIGFRLREIRTKRGLTQKELAKKINRSVAAISSYESNTQTPPADVLLSISPLLKVPLAYFVDDNCEECYTTSGLTDEQKACVELLFKEFTSPTATSTSLSAQQIEIIGKLFSIFQSSNGHEI